MTAVAAQEKVLRVGLESPVHTLDPRKAQDLVSALVVRQIFETPFALAADADLVESGILRAPLESEGPLVCSAPVRPGISFSDAAGPSGVKGNFIAGMPNTVFPPAGGPDFAALPAGLATGTAICGFWGAAMGGAAGF